MTRDLVLVAASGLAREVLAAARASGTYESFVVVDDDPRRWGTSLDGVPVVGGLEEVKALDDHDVVTCAGAGSSRRAIAARLGEMGIAPERWARIVHPAVEGAAGCAIGPGSILLAGTVLTADVVVGAHVVVMPHVILTHDCVVEDHATLCAGVGLGGGVRVGDASYVGMHACVRQGLVVGAGSVLGMGSVLLRDLPPDQTWAGVPAAPLPTPTSRGARP